MKEPATKIETYWSEKDKIIITDVYHLGDLKDPAVGLEAMVSYEPETTTKVRGIRVYTEGDDISSRYFAFIDFDEIDGLSNAIVKMIEINKDQRLAPDKIRSDALYTCKGGFKVQLQQ